MKNRKVLISSFIMILSFMITFFGVTYAWFSDSVSSDNNIIISGNLDVEVEYLDELGNWQSLTNDVSVFDKNALWEPGHTEVVYLKISNVGSLSIKYSLDVNIVDEVGSVNVYGEKFLLSDYIKYGTVDGVSTPFASRDEAKGQITSSTIISERFNKKATINAGEAADYVAMVVFMPEEVGNVANSKTGEEKPQITLGISLYATQSNGEGDSFGNDYDSGASFPEIPNYFKMSAPVDSLSVDNTLTSAINIGDDNTTMSALIPVGVKIEDGASEVSLEVKSNIDSEVEFKLNDSQSTRSFDVHINGIAKDNTVPMIIDLGCILLPGLKDSSIGFYHVEDGQSVKMTLVEEFTEHNQFKYNPDNGNVILYIAGFSEIAAIVDVSDPWNGSVDTTWYTAGATEYLISSAEALAGLGELVSNGVDFKGITIKLTNDLDLGGETSGLVFYPIGYKSETPDDVYPFKGTFDGQGHRIRDLYQNTWNIKGNYNGTYYNQSLGLFAYLQDATVKNLVLENFLLEGEFAPTGCVAGYAEGNMTFENITLHQCRPSTYNTGVAGIVGWDGGSNSVYTFDNINIDSTNTVIALWGSWDVGCGGIMGHLGNTSTATIKNSVIAPILDVYNDVTANYQYYRYRYSGMLIGTIGRGLVPKSENLTCENVKVYYGDWADYYYCEFEKNTGASYTEDFQFSRVDEKDIVFDLNGKAISCTHTHTDNEDKMAYYLPFYQLYSGYGYGAENVTEHAGVEIIKRYAYTITYMSGTNVLDVVYVNSNDEAYTNLLNPGEGYNWINSSSQIVTSIPAGNKNDVVLYLDNKDVYVARFLDSTGKTIYEEEFLAGATSLQYPPQNPPTITGYTGVWENYEEKLKNATGDITIKPIYSVSSDFEILGQNVTMAQLFQFLEEGKSIIMSKDMSGSITGGSVEKFCSIGDGVASRLDFNSYELSYSCDSSANKKWTLFEVQSGGTLTIGPGISGEGTLVFSLDKLNKNATPCIFDIQNGGKLVLERGVSIEIRFPSKSEATVTLIKGISDLNTTNYPGLNIIEDTSGNYTIYKIVVTGNTTLIGNISNQ